MGLSVTTGLVNGTFTFSFVSNEPLKADLEHRAQMPFGLPDLYTQLLERLASLAPGFPFSLGTVFV